MALCDARLLAFDCSVFIVTKRFVFFHHNNQYNILLVIASKLRPPNRLKVRKDRQKCLVGVFQNQPKKIYTIQLGGCDFDMFCIDREHTRLVFLPNLKALALESNLGRHYLL